MSIQPSRPLIACRVCGLVHLEGELARGEAEFCGRCGHELARRTPFSLHLTGAFALSALFFYFPANLFPILHMSMFGRVTENTILKGVIRFYQDGDYFVAIVVFLASVLVPLLKILGILALVISTHVRSPRLQHARTRLFVTVELLGKWAMLDVFALAVLISLLKMGRMASVMAGRGAFAFVMVVLFTIMASASFDPQLIWKDREIEK